MKNICFKLCVFAFVFSVSSVFSQKTNYLVTRLNFKLLDWQKIDDPSIGTRSLQDFLSPAGKDSLKALISNGYMDVSNLATQKIFPHLKTSDSLSMSRQGDIVIVPPFWATFRIEIPEDMEWKTFYNRLKGMYPVVIYVDPPMKIVFDDIPNDSLFSEQESLRDTLSVDLDIAVDSAWNVETGKRFIKVGVFDSGIDSLHPDLKVLGGYSYYDDWIQEGNTIVHSWGRDESGHGSRVAGIIGAKRNNGIGIAGIAGGDGSSDTSGVSLLDFKLGIGNSATQVTGDWISMALIDASRAPLNYYDWTESNEFGPPSEEYYFQSAPGYGIHIGNHSYSFLSEESPEHITVDELPIDTTAPPPQPVIISDCHLCRESYLFSLQNGVSNFTSRGNNTDPFDLTSPYGLLPQSYHDSWLTVVGASGVDGEQLIGLSNGSPGESWNSPIGNNLDIIAPGSYSNVASTYSSNTSNFSNFGWYVAFNGTSASSPHTAGVAALLMSRYNKPCYSNLNLDPADIEYILEQSATDVSITGPDDSTGYGRLNAWKAMQMIDLPFYQIVHPPDEFVNMSVLSMDTVTFFLDKPLQPLALGPIGSNFPLEIERHYLAERYEVELTYDFSAYMGGTTQLLDTWVRHSQTNSLDLMNDTVTEYVGSPVPSPVFVVDTFTIHPMAYITDVINDSIIKIRGYYYHFVGRYPFNNDLSLGTTPIEAWYPINFNDGGMRMAYSIYIYDEFGTFYDFPCDSDNILIDSLASVGSMPGDGELTIFPNPGSDLLNVVLPDSFKTGKLEMFDPSGKKLYTDRYVNTPHCSFPVANLSKGLYLVVVSDDSGRQLTKKWIKQ